MFKYILAATLTFISTAAYAETFYVGTWHNDYSSCDAAEGEGQPLRLSETEFFGLENQCDMVDPKYLRNIDGIEGVMFQMNCMGEGTEYTDHILLLKEYDGKLTVHKNNFTNVYSRCE